MARFEALNRKTKGQRPPNDKGGVSKAVLQHRSPTRCYHACFQPSLNPPAPWPHPPRGDEDDVVKQLKGLRPRLQQADEEGGLRAEKGAHSAACSIWPTQLRPAEQCRFISNGFPLSPGLAKEGTRREPWQDLGRPALRPSPQPHPLHVAEGAQALHDLEGGVAVQARGDLH